MPRRLEVGLGAFLWAATWAISGGIQAAEPEATTAGEVTPPPAPAGEPEPTATTDTDASDASGSGSDNWYLDGRDEPFDLSDYLLKEDLDFSLDFGGWGQIGYTSRSTGLFNSDPDRLNVHQMWFYVEKATDGSKGFDWGGRVDAMYGTDSGDTQAFGNNAGRWDFANGWDRGGGYGFAFPQLYAELAYHDFKVKGGHFYTLLGYEVVTAPDNFFFSHALTMYNSEAFTHTGVLGTYTAPESVVEDLPIAGLEVYGGWTLGWDTGFDQFNNGSNFLGGASVGVLDNLTVIYITTVGDLGWIGSGYAHSIVADWQITDKLNYVFQSDYNRYNGDPDAGTTRTEAFGVNQYLLYWLNDSFGVGGRFEWWKTGSDNYLVATAGVNVKPIANINVRPEIRYQWSPDNPANPAVPDDEFIFGVDAILTY